MTTHESHQRTDHRNGGHTRKPRVDNYPVIVSLEALPGKRELVEDAFRWYTRLVRARAGTLYFTAHQDSANPDRFVVFEIDADTRAFRQHVASPECREFNQQVGPLIVGGAAAVTRLRTL